MTDQTYKQQPLFPELEPDTNLDLIPNPPQYSLVQPGDYLFIKFKAGFFGTFALSVPDIESAIKDWAKNSNDPVPMILPTPLHPGISGIPDEAEAYSFAMTVVDRSLVEDIQFIPQEHLQQFVEEYAKQHPIEQAG